MSEFMVVEIAKRELTTRNGDRLLYSVFVRKDEPQHECMLVDEKAFTDIMHELEDLRALRAELEGERDG